MHRGQTHGCWPDCVFLELFAVLTVKVLDNFCELLSIHKLKDHENFVILYINLRCFHHMVAINDLHQFCLLFDYLGLIFCIWLSLFHDKVDTVRFSFNHADYAIHILIDYFYFRVILQRIPANCQILVAIL